MQKLQTQGVHHITLVGASRQISIDFWEGVLGMPFVMDSIDFRDPLGQRIELACYKFEPPLGVAHVQVLMEAHRLRVAEGAYNITDAQLATAIERLVRRTQESLSQDREARHAYEQPVAGP